MKKSLICSMAIVLLFALFNPDIASATKHTVSVQDFSFSPASIPDVTVGDTIRWVWVSGTHTTTSTTIPSGAVSWNHSITSTSTSYEYKVLVAGTYNYKCTPHAAMGMVASFVAKAQTASLSITPLNRDVSAAAGSTTFAVTSNSSWTAVSDVSWCTVTPSGSGNGTLNAQYTDNPTNASRVATITITVSGIAPTEATVTQSMGTLSVNDNPANAFKIYPNPSNGKFTIAPGEKNNQTFSEVSILDQSGKLVYKYPGNGSENMTFDLSALPQGNYFVNIVTSEGIKKGKIELIK